MADPVFPKGGGAIMINERYGSTLSIPSTHKSAFMFTKSTTVHGVAPGPWRLMVNPPLTGTVF